MRMGLPCCPIKYCRYHFDGNCTAIGTYRDYCEYRATNKTLEEMQARLAERERERDAAVRFISSGRKKDCDSCKYEQVDTDSTPCRDCHSLSSGNYEWRGPATVGCREEG